jgi:hypothetical protein
MAASATVTTHHCGRSPHQPLICWRDGDRDRLIVLDEHPFALSLDRAYHLELSVSGNWIEDEIDGTLLVEAIDDDPPLCASGVALVVTQGTRT